MVKAIFLLLCIHQLLSPSVGFSQRSSITSSSLSSISHATPLMQNIEDMEKEVMASARKKMDQQRIVSALDTTTASTANQPNENQQDPEKKALLASPWQISAAAGITAFVGCECVTHSNFISAVVLIGVALSAFSDPVDDEGLLGAISRLLGRATIKTVESSKPRLQRIARAAILDDGDEDYFKTAAGRQRLDDPRLAQYIDDLEKENASLLLWKERRELVDQYTSFYSLENLQTMAKERGIDCNCRKPQLMMKLVEAGVINLH